MCRTRGRIEETLRCRLQVTGFENGKCIITRGRYVERRDGGAQIRQCVRMARHACATRLRASSGECEEARSLESSTDTPMQWFRM